jgi:hypothetical protein
MNECVDLESTRATSIASKILMWSCIILVEDMPVMALREMSRSSSPSVSETVESSIYK